MSSGITTPLIFIHPISSVVKELMNFYSENPEGVEIYEVDSIGEATQLIGSVGQALVLSSDLKKLAQILQDNRKIIASVNTKSLLISQNNVPGKILSKLMTIGLTDSVLNNINFKTLQHKVRLLIKSIQTNNQNKANETVTLASSKNSQATQESQFTSVESNYQVKPTSTQETASSNFQEKNIDTRLMTKSSSGPSLPEKEYQLKPVSERNIEAKKRTGFKEREIQSHYKTSSIISDDRLKKEISTTKNETQENNQSKKNNENVIELDSKKKNAYNDNLFQSGLETVKTKKSKQEIDYQRIKESFDYTEQIFHANLKSLDLMIRILHKHLEKEMSLINFLKYVFTIIENNFQGEAIFFTYNSNKGFFEETYNSILEKDRNVVSDYHVYYKNLKKESYLWQQATFPKWNDETFAKNENFFVFPFYSGMAHLGFAVVYFVKPFAKDKAFELEVILETARAFYLREYTESVNPNYQQEAAPYKDKQVSLWQKIKNVFKRAA